MSREELKADFTQKKFFLDFFMLRRLESVFRDEKKFFSKNFFFKIFSKIFFSKFFLNFFFEIYFRFFFKISFTFEYQQEDEMILVIFFYFLHFTHTICVNFSEWTEQIYFLQREHLIRVRFFLPFSQISHTTLRDGVIL